MQGTHAAAAVGDASGQGTLSSRTAANSSHLLERLVRLWRWIRSLLFALSVFHLSWSEIFGTVWCTPFSEAFVNFTVLISFVRLVRTKRPWQGQKLWIYLVFPPLILLAKFIQKRFQRVCVFLMLWTRAAETYSKSCHFYFYSQVGTQFSSL